MIEMEIRIKCVNIMKNVKSVNRAESVLTRLIRKQLHMYSQKVLQGDQKQL